MTQMPSTTQDLVEPPTPYKGITKLSEGAVNPKGLDVEQTILEAAGLWEISGWVSLRNMEEGDVVMINSYAKLGPKSDFELHESSTYRGTQVETSKESSLRFLNFVSCYGIKITLTQTAGTPRVYHYLFFRKD